jgi:hypothetical protein
LKIKTQGIYADKIQLEVLMFSFLKYIIFTLGLIAAYVLFEHFFFNNSENRTLSNSVEQAEKAIISKAQDISDDLKNPVEVETENME